MRILHVLFSFRIAGSERYCIDLANRQAAAGHEVHVAGMRTAALRAALSDRITYHSFRRIFRGLLLCRLVARLAPDICHGHLSGACKALKGVSPRQQTVATLHVGYKPHQHEWLDGLICVNRTQAGRLPGYRGLARTIPNWLPLPPVQNSEKGIREELGLGENVFLVGAVGRLHASKGMDLLIAAFQAAALENAALVILGEGPQRAKLEQLRAGDPRIHLVGYRPDVYPSLHDLDLFVSPSREESFGLAIIEAMSTGLPIIATAAEGPGEYLLDQPVTLVPTGSMAALAAGIAAAHRQYRTTGLARIGYDLSNFDSSARLADIIDFYSAVVEAGQWRFARQENSGVAVAT
jgi:glycosyltransferase involved in cell wall biosynthesis